MQLGYVFKIASSNLRDRKLRSGLTIAGMIIGIGLVVFLTSLGFGLQRLIKNQITNADALTVLDVTTGSSLLLQLDNQAIEPFHDIEGVSKVSPSINLSGRIFLDDTLTDVAVFSVDPDFLGLEGINIVWGEGFSGDDDKETVVSNTTVELLGFSNPNEILGKTVTYEFTLPVIDEATGENTGETKVAKSSAVVKGVVVDELAVSYVPLAVAAQFDIDNYDLVRIKVQNQSVIPSVRADIEKYGFKVDSIVDTIGQIDRIFFVFQFIVAGLGFVAMFVASLGTFNTLTVSLLERTREIGIMKSLGAKQKDIYLLFMIESLLIGIFGSLFGVVFGYIVGEVLNFVVNILASNYGGQSVDIFRTPLIFIIVIFLAVFSISIFTGLYPARRASRINPLDAIRYE